MPCVTYIEECRIKYYEDTLQDKEIQELLDEINKPEKRYVIEKRIITERKWFKTKEYSKYSLYYDTKFGIEWQVINFATDLSEEESNAFSGHSVTRATILNFLMAFLNGRENDKPSKMVLTK